MPKRRGAAPAEDPERVDRELAEFAKLEGIPPADPRFRERLRSELWELLQELVSANEDEDRR